MHCPKCQSVVEEGELFCPACGAPQLPPRPDKPGLEGDSGVRNPYAGKSEQILGFAVFSVGLLWSCGTTAATQGNTNYAWPIAIMLAGAVLWVLGKLREKSHRR